jgi:peptidoglycan/LPS O-acetylase OafA/YrhL
MAVVAGHFSFSQFMAGVHHWGTIAGVAVACFFVLSGYVITYVANEKERTLKQYAISRMARIYSVAVPAIILTLAIDFYLIHRGDGAFFHAAIYEYKQLWKYLPIFLFFGSEVAGFHAQVFSDGPFWSLSYEVWYYIAFAAFFYLRGTRRLLFGLAATVILGVPALLYFPIWILGSIIYSAHQRISVSHPVAAVGAFGTASLLLVLIIINFFNAADNAVNIALHGWPSRHLHNSANFASFYIAGLVTGAHIFFVRYCRLQFLSGENTRRAITYAASFTFAIYLSHRPLMNLWAFVIDHNPNSPLSIFILAVLVLFSCWCFGFASEKQKEQWRALFKRILNMRDKSSTKFKMRPESGKTTIS